MADTPGVEVDADAPAADPQTRPELVIGLVGPIGTDLDSVLSALKRSLETVGYNLQVIDLMEGAMAIGDAFGVTCPTVGELHEQYAAKMNVGNELRAAVALRRGKEDEADALARVGMAEVVDRRGGVEQPVAYVFKQLKTPGEVGLLRQVYGANCVILAAYTPKREREDQLARRIAQSMHEQTTDRHRALAVQLVARDQSEPGRHGQDIENAFPLADVFIDARSQESCRRQVSRFVEILFQHPVRTPRKDEFGMYQAYGAALRSADWGRQVGCAVCDDDGEVVAVGMNEVPRAHGGQYWEDDDTSLDNRDWTRPQDSNAMLIRGILADLLKRMRHRGWLSGTAAEYDLNLDEKLVEVESLLTGPIDDAPEGKEYLRERAQIRNIIEFYRSVHAEMSALTSAVRRGASVKGLTMYVTTFPCHECAKHIVASGIRRLVFIEPYPKSRVPDLYDDSVRIDEPTDDRRIGFEAFVGVAPRRYTQWFMMPKRKDANGWINWESIRKDAVPRGARMILSYENAERLAAAGLYSESAEANKGDDEHA